MKRLNSTGSLEAVHHLDRDLVSPWPPDAEPANLRASGRTTDNGPTRSYSAGRHCTVIADKVEIL
jgi:hypothetical protein